MSAFFTEVLRIKIRKQTVFVLQVALEIIDRCLMEESSVLQVSVVSIGRIEVQVIDWQ